MPKKKFLHEDSSFRELISIVAEQKGMLPFLIEKDYWLMHCLWGLQEASFKFELKGGTSLSKGFKLIDRFSEDVDIRIEPPASLKVKCGKNHNKPDHLESRRDFFSWIVSTLKIPGIISIVRDLDFDDDKLRNGGIRLNYQSYFTEVSVIKPFVLLEVGFDEITPTEAHDISSWACEYAFSLDDKFVDNRARQIKCYLPEYTLIEKLDAVIRRFHKEQKTGVMPKNFLRHYYDIYCLLQSERVRHFIKSNDYQNIKATRMTSELGFDLSREEAFLLGNRDARERYKMRFNQIKDFFYKEPPEFEEILTEIQKYLPKL